MPERRFGNEDNFIDGVAHHRTAAVIGFTGAVWIMTTETNGTRSSCVCLISCVGVLEHTLFVLCLCCSNPCLLHFCSKLIGCYSCFLIWSLPETLFLTDVRRKILTISSRVVIKDWWRNRYLMFSTWRGKIYPDRCQARQFRPVWLPRRRAASMNAWHKNSRRTKLWNRIQKRLVIIKIH